jgi:Cu+-exporting ATPase
LQQSDVGIAISDDLNNFSPASDAILDGHQFVHLPAFFELARWSRIIIWLSFLLSLMYNVVGLSFAVQGELSPVVAAILMPISSISIIVFTTVFVRIVSARLFRS